MDLRWGFLGAGNVTAVRASPSAAFTQDGSRVVTVMRSTLDRAEEFARGHGIPRACDSVEGLCGDPEVNAVYVCSPPHLHRDHVLAAIRAGKHVLCEKPMALTAADCLEMVREADRVGVTLAVALYRRFYPVVERLRDVIQSGQIGKVNSAQVVKHDYIAPSREEVAGDVRLQWILAPRLSGGILHELGTHRLDLLLYLLGDPASVTAEIEQLQSAPAVAGQAAVTIRFAGEAIAQSYHSWCNPSPRDLLAVGGTEGQAIIEDLEADRLLVQVGSRVETIDVGPRPRATHRAVVADFLRAVNGDHAVRCSGADGARVSQLIELSYQAARERRTIDVPPLSY